ncbi:BnaAnng10800D [Brassica napus]|uniref:BnaAnng10800D protein n=1 Tax=Brassica napus TaxID=3708 RepID=A0A078INQ2_BRANA|nr:BnaAnng10800D [Brassica napus]
MKMCQNNWALDKHHQICNTGEHHQMFNIGEHHQTLNHGLEIKVENQSGSGDEE